MLNLQDSFELIVCYSYGSYTNLQNLCDYDVKHKVKNAQGGCFSDLKVITKGALATVEYELDSDAIQTVADLSQEI